MDIGSVRKESQPSQNHFPVAENMDKSRKGEHLRAEMLFCDQEVSSDDPNKHRRPRWHCSCKAGAFPKYKGIFTTIVGSFRRI